MDMNNEKTLFSMLYASPWYLQMCKRLGNEDAINKAIGIALIAGKQRSFKYFFDNNGYLNESQLKYCKQMSYFPPHDYLLSKWFHDNYGFYGKSSIYEFIDCIHKSLYNTLEVPDLLDIVKSFL